LLIVVLFGFLNIKSVKIYFSTTLLLYKLDTKEFARIGYQPLIGDDDTGRCTLIKDEVLITVGCPIFPSILIAKYLFTGSLKKTIDNLETQKKYMMICTSYYLLF
jgi:hypothetical protein